MPTLGEELRHRREQRSITLAEISEATRIGTRFLKAIETDNFSILPGGIFTRSFIRAYAKHVGMNEDEAIGLYLQQVAGPNIELQETAETTTTTKPAAQAEKVKEPPAVATPVTEQAAPTSGRSRRFEPVAFRQSAARTSWSTIVIAAGILIFLVIIILALVKQLNQGSGETGSQAKSGQDSAPPKLAPQQPAEQPSSPPSQTESREVPPGQPLVIKLEAATGDSWIRYQIDDSKPTTLVLKQGQSQDLPAAQSQITLSYGNRLTLRLKINDRDANFPPDTPKFASQVVISRNNFQTYLQ
jgi:transcriptional regulator with XRE-family HTH domain